MEKDALHLWFAYPDDLLDEQAADACAGVLSARERERWQRFKFDRHRREYLATHALARNALSHYQALPPERLHFSTNKYGKLAIAPPCNLHFNLSNSLGLVVCLIAEGAEVGVDIESHERADTIAEVGPTMFSPQELAQLDSLTGAAKAERCLRLWTLKEAYIKARGMGLALPLDKFSFLFSEKGEIRLQIDSTLQDNADRWRFCVLDHAGHAIALMIENRTIPGLQLCEARPPFAAPEQFNSFNQVWNSGS
jgi:4'-phosphopantetheinyl transferase